MLRGLIFVRLEMAVGWEGNEINIVFIGHGLASFAPAEVDEFL